MMDVPGLFALQFHPAETDPTEEGDYLLYNQCDGYHFASPYFYDGKFEAFMSWKGSVYEPDWYCAWALLPTSHTTLFDLFAKKPPALDSGGAGEVGS